ncbi:MAG: isochorismatase family protein [Coriobacteriales bacterium]|jgi:nicotinamidase-related amidase|nr:isochorismatase family protein [Coriobacteriales bacterium]
MTSIQPIRDPKTDHLLTPQNSLLTIIDYQPTQIHSINSMRTNRLVENIVLVAKIANAFGLPVVLSTVNVENGRNKDTIEPIKEQLQGVPSYDRTAINAWEDAQYLAAVKETGRKKLIICALWTEVCLTLPTLDAIKDGYDVYPVVDAVGGTSYLAHKTGLRRMEQAGAKLVTIPQILCELQRDWNRNATGPAYLDLMFASGAFVKL